MMMYKDIRNKIYLWCKGSTATVTYFSVVTFSLIVASTILTLSSPSSDFPVSRIITIEDGMTLSSVSLHLKERGVIRSEMLFKILVSLEKDSVGVLAGDYFFAQPLTTYNLAHVFIKGEFGLAPEKITIHEGSTVYDVAEQFGKRFAKFNSERFLEKAESLEGYLFPDTYFFLPNVTDEQVIAELFETFNIRLGEVSDLFLTSEYSVSDIIIMASIIEKEAWKEHDQRLISGVLWNRIDSGMLLQVDATFNYINGKNTYELTLEDLKIDSPYNTYKHKGLPVGPISNPGLTAIKAALEPTPSDYYFYLADRSGNTYYAEDFEQHKVNRQLYMN